MRWKNRLWKVADLDPPAAGGGGYRDIGGGMGAALNTTAAAMNRLYPGRPRQPGWSFGHRAGMAIVLEGDPRLLNRC